MSSLSRSSPRLAGVNIVIFMGASTPFHGDPISFIPFPFDKGKGIKEKKPIACGRQ